MQNLILELRNLKPEMADTQDMENFFEPLDATVEEQFNFYLDNHYAMYQPWY